MPRKPNYIGKYDFMRYFTRPKSLWFWSNDELEEAFNKKKLDVVEEDEESLNENDSLETYKEKKFANEINNVDNKRFPEIEEGKILEKKFIEYIKNTYDADQYIEIPSSSNENMAKQTAELLNNNNSIVIFQATFIDPKLRLITKVDALVKDGTNKTIIEFKGTTTTKLKHIYDLYFQYKILTSLGYKVNPRLAIIRYCRNDKEMVDFIETDTCNTNKNGDSGKPGQSLETRQMKKIGKSEAKGDYFFLKEIFDSTPSIKDMDYKFINNFKVIINELLNHEIEKKFEIKLSDFNKSPIGYEYQKEIKDILSVNYPGFGYSALNESNWYFDKMIGNYQASKFYDFHDQTKNLQKKKVVLSKQDDISKDALANLFESIKGTKVYFDFETVNNAIAIFDNTLPFQQIVVQCSVIKVNSKGQETSVDNLIVDPLEVEVEFLKYVVDTIYTDEEDVSYLVYYHTFEKSRLNEIKDIIGEESYSIKIDKIISHLFDLIDFFKTGGSNSNFPGVAPVMFKDAKFFSSIKKILPILEHKYSAIISKAHAKDYKSLEIQNGSEALAAAKFRSFKMISDKEWKKTVEDLKVYCENDVRAMIAIYLFVENLYKNI